MSIVARAVIVLSVLSGCSAPDVSSRMAFDPYLLTPITE
jgi:hypothetical protein